MKWLISRLAGAAPSNETVGWSVSVAVHLLGALAASVAASGLAPVEAPRLPGLTTRVDLQIRLAEPEPQQIAAEILPAETRVLVMPHRAEVAERTFFETGTDVSRPEPEELALVERWLALPPPAVLPRSAAEAEALAAPADAPPAVRTSRRTKTVELPPLEVGAMALASRSPAVAVGETSLPRPVDNRPPKYPEQALIERLEGTVLLRAQIGAEGGVERLEILASSGHAILDAAAFRAVRTWRFAPATRAGVPVASAVRLPVRFALQAP